MINRDPFPLAWIRNLGDPLGKLLSQYLRPLQKMLAKSALSLYILPCPEMNHDSFAREIRCPVYGFIGLTSLECEILGHPAFQRLRRIKQLAWTDYVYPGATHTRFEHSLGVMHLASKLYEAVVASSRDVLREVFKYTDAGLARDWQIVRLAGLLHDIGHGPFSHAAEKLLPNKIPETNSLFPDLATKAEQFSHEDYSVAIIEILLKDIIEQHPASRRNYKIAVDEVTSLISKKAVGGASLFWKDLISSQLDADRMDYLQRDSLHAGVSYGRFDLDRILASICVLKRPQEESLEPKIAIMRGGFHAVEALIIARYWMHKQVYFHKTRVICDHHLHKALEYILTAEKNAGRIKEPNFPAPTDEENLRGFLRWDDFCVMGLLADGKGGEHGERLMNRNHYRLVGELEEADTTVKEILASKVRNKRFIDSLGDKVKHVANPNASWYKTKAASDEILIVDDDGREAIGLLSHFSALMKSINFGSLQYVYVNAPDAKDCRDAFKTFLREMQEQAVDVK